MDIAKFSTQELIKIVSNLLDSMLHTNNQIPNTQITYFHSRAVPNITVVSYLTRIHKFAPFSNEALLSILIYFDAIAKLENGFTINSFNIHRLLITSLVVASKFTSDIFYANSRYAKVGGIPLRELNQLELEFLFLIDFQLHITLEDLQEYADQLLSHAMSLPNHSIPSQQQEISSSIPINTHNNNNNNNNLSNTIRTNSTTTNTTAAQKNVLIMPLTPPYNSSAEHENTRKKVSLHHPYQRPNNVTMKKKRLGLVSPKEDS